MLMGSAFAANAQEITFAMEPSYPPFETTNEKGEIIGFDVDVANAIGKEIQATCHFKSQAFDALIPGLKSKRFDASISAIDIIFGDTAVLADMISKEAEIQFVGDKVTDKKYFGNGLGIAVNKSSKELLESLNKGLETVKANGEYQKIYDKWMTK